MNEGPTPHVDGRVVPQSGPERSLPRPATGDLTSPLEGCISLAAALGSTLLGVQHLDRAAPADPFSH